VTGVKVIGAIDEESDGTRRNKFTACDQQLMKLAHEVPTSK